MRKIRTPQEGELFQIVTVDNYKFELRYGYYEETDRLMDDPVPIYPDFKEQPVYTQMGRPLVTAVQKPCEYFKSLEGYEYEECCSSCVYYPDMKTEINVCQCENCRISISKEA